MGRRVAGSLGVLATLATLLMAGCVPTSTPSPSPSPPSPPVSPTENVQEREERIAYEQAESNYRKVSAEYDRVAAAGGSLDPTPTLRRYAGGEFLEQYAKGLRQQKEIGAKSRGKSRIAYVRPSGYSTTRLQLLTCEDGRGIQIIDSDGKVLGNGILAQVSITAEKRGGTWMMWALDESKVQSC